MYSMCVLWLKFSWCTFNRSVGYILINLHSDMADDQYDIIIQIIIISILQAFGEQVNNIFTFK